MEIENQAKIERVPSSVWSGDSNIEKEKKEKRRSRQRQESREREKRTLGMYVLRKIWRL